MGAHCNPRFRLRCLAIDAAGAGNMLPKVSPISFGRGWLFELIAKFNSPTELLVVVGGVGTKYPSKVKFTQPELSPSQYTFKIRKSLHSNVMYSVQNQRITWRELELKLEHLLSKFKEIYEKGVKREMQGTDLLLHPSKQDHC